MRGIDPYLFMTDFSEYKTGTQPGDWAFEYTASTSFTAQTISGSISGTGVSWVKAASGRQGIRWSRVPTFGNNVEILTRFRRTSLGSSTQTVVFNYWQGAGVSGSETGVRAGLGVGSTTTTLQYNSTRYVSGTAVSNTSIAVLTGSNANEWVWMRTRQEGNIIYGAFWKDGTSEPSLTLIDNNAANNIGTGWVGVQGITPPTCEIDFFGVGLNGRTVPLPG